MQDVLAQMTSVRDGYTPPFLLWNNNIQTIYSVLGRPVPRSLSYDRKILPNFFADGEKVVLDYLYSKDKTKAPAAVLLVLHGLSGGSHDRFIQYIALSSQRQGWDSVVLHRRGCGEGEGVELTIDKHYDYSNHEDMHRVFKHVASQYDRSKTKVFAVWISAGANSLLNVLGKYPKDPVVDAAFSIGNGYSWEKGTRAIEKNSPFWNAMLTTLAYNVFYKRHKVMLNTPKVDKHLLSRAWGLRQFDEAVSRRVHGYNDLVEFYEAQSCLHVVQNITVPTLCLNAVDDPVSDVTLVPLEKIKGNPNVALVTTPHGGHLGWARGWNGQDETYMEVMAIDYFSTVLALSKWWAN